MAGTDNKQVYNNLQGSTNQMLIVAGSFEVDGTNDPTNVRGDGFTVSYVSAGRFRVTFARPFTQEQVISFVPGWEDEDAGTADDVLPSSEILNESRSSIDIRVAVGSILTNDDGPRVNFIGVFNVNRVLAKTHV